MVTRVNPCAHSALISHDDDDHDGVVDNDDDDDHYDVDGDADGDDDDDNDVPVNGDDDEASILALHEVVSSNLSPIGGRLLSPDKNKLNQS